MPELLQVVRGGVKTAIPNLSGMSAMVIAGDLSIGDGKAYIRIGPKMQGHNIVTVAAALTAPSTSGIPTVQIARGRQAAPGSAHTWVDVLSTRITIDQGEYDSKDAAAPAVIDTSADDLQTGDLLRIDVDVAGTGAKNLIITIETQRP
ncbi:MAG: hypothetical protein HGB01_10750 [Chlorobiaceae bacterium]|nr:hypothetical protein [Chlorobiaceae bacterium]